MSRHNEVCRTSSAKVWLSVSDCLLWEVKSVWRSIYFASGGKLTAVFGKDVPWDDQLIFFNVSVKMERRSKNEEERYIWSVHYFLEYWVTIVFVDGDQKQTEYHEKSWVCALVANTLSSGWTNVRSRNEKYHVILCLTESSCLAHSVCNYISYPQNLVRTPTIKKRPTKTHIQLVTLELIFDLRTSTARTS